MNATLETKEIRGINLKALLAVVSITASIVGSAVYTSGRIESRIDTAITSQEQNQRINDLKMQQMQAQIEQLHNEVLLNRKFIESK